MRFALLVQGDPAHSPSAISALRFAEAVVVWSTPWWACSFRAMESRWGSDFDARRGMKVIFSPLGEGFRALRPALQLCVASALRRGLVDEQEAKRAGLAAATRRCP